jgi:DNA-binding CsgD family transcriptional regulator/Tol biopolymer transport system component
MRRGRRPHPELLTPREQEVLELLRLGLTNQQIADQLGIGVFGARYHVSEILSKLGVSTREEAAAWQGEMAGQRGRWFGFVPFGLFGRPSLEAIMRTSSVVFIGAGVTGFALLLAGVLLLAARNDTSTPSLGRVAYVVDGNVWVRDLPDGAPAQLTDSGADSNPRLSASGEWIALWRQEESPNQPWVWVMRTDGSDARAISSRGRIAWSPTRAEFTYASDDNELVVESADGMTSRVLLTAPAPQYGISMIAGFPQWSRDGGWVAFTDVFNRPDPGQPGATSYAVFRVAASGGSPELLLRFDRGRSDGGRSEVTPSLYGWAPDGGSFLYAENESVHVEPGPDGRRPEPPPAVEIPLPAPVHAQPLDGSTPLELIPLSLDDELLPSLDGVKAAGTEVTARGSWHGRRIVLIDPTMGDTAYLTDPSMAAIWPAPSPDGPRVAYSAAPAADGAEASSSAADEAVSQRRIWLTDADGSSHQQLTDDPAYRDEYPVWLSDRHLLFVRISLAEEGTISLWMLDLDSEDLTIVAPRVMWAGYMVEGVDLRYHDRIPWPSLLEQARP